MKTRLLLATTALICLSMLPAQANTLLKEQCNTYTSPNGARSVKVCVAVVTDDASQPQYWGRTKFTSVAGQSEPYRVYGVNTRFWSLPNVFPQPSWCDGNAPNCTGGGDSTGDSSTSLPATFTSNSLSWHAHYDLVHANGSFSIEWTNGGATESHNINSAPDKSTAPWCRFWGPGDAYCSG